MAKWIKVAVICSVMFISRLAACYHTFVWLKLHWEVSANIYICKRFSFSWSRSKYDLRCPLLHLCHVYTQVPAQLHYLCLLTVVKVTHVSGFFLQKKVELLLSLPSCQQTPPLSLVAQVDRSHGSRSLKKQVNLKSYVQREKKRMLRAVKVPRKHNPDHES